MTAPSAVVTGAASGIGRAVAEELAATGWRVVGVDRDATPLEDLAQRGVLAEAVAGDVADRDVHRRATAAAGRVGTFAAWVGAAGIVDTYELTTMGEDQARRIVDVNQLGVLWGASAAVDAWLDVGSGGAVVVISSIHARRASPDHAVYEMTKAAGEALVRNVAVTYGARGIRAVAVAPGAVATPALIASLETAADPEAARRHLEGQSPSARIATSEEIAAAVAFVISDRASYVSGTTLTVDGGWTAALSRPPQDDRALRPPIT